MTSKGILGGPAAMIYRSARVGQFPRSEQEKAILAVDRRLGT